MIAGIARFFGKF